MRGTRKVRGGGKLKTVELIENSFPRFADPTQYLRGYLTQDTEEPTDTVMKGHFWKI